MKNIRNIISHLMTLAFGILVMPIFILLTIISPIYTLEEAYKIISTGYTVNGIFVDYVFILTMLMYFSLRIRPFRRIYAVFPSLYELLKYIVISYVFIGVGTEILNWSYVKLSPSRKLIGIGTFILSLILWRIFVSLYYTKKPISQVVLEKSEKLQNYNSKLN